MRYDHNTGFGLLVATRPRMISSRRLGHSSELKPGDPVLVVSHGGSDAMQEARGVLQRVFAD